MGIQLGNNKLGLIYHWSIPAIKTCPGRSTKCSDLCYADRGFYKMPNVERSLLANYELTKKTNFVDYMLAKLQERHIRLMRIHCSGDFYSAAYMAKWLKIARLARTTTFFAYTRSWRTRSGSLPPWYPSIIAFSRLANVRLWLSCDQETGPPPQWQSVKRAYMAINDDDHPEFPVDLIFRVEGKASVMKKDDGVQVCPHEQGLATSRSILCDKCELCFSNRKPIWQNKALRKPAAKSVGRRGTLHNRRAMSY